MALYDMWTGTDGREWGRRQEGEEGGKGMSESQTKPSFCQWFNVDDIDHLHAYHVLQNTGIWPVGFIPEGIYMEPGWQHILAFLLADRWIDHKLSECQKS